MSPSFATATPARAPSAPSAPARALIAVALFCFFAVFFLILRSNQFTAVDGALRCLEVYHHPHIFFHGNNHMLYPVDILAWSKLAGLLGLSAATPGEYMRISQGMNCFAAAATVALLWLLINSILEDTLVSILFVAVYAFSRAFLLHAINSAEPMLALMYAMAAVLLIRIAVRRANPALVFLSGILIALALATYQAMFLAIAACLWMCLFEKPEANTVARQRIWILSLFLVCCAAAASLIYGLAYSIQGVPFGWPMLRHFLQIGGGAEIYAGFSVSRILNFPIGFLNDLAPVVPPGYAGLRFLLHRPHNAGWLAAIAATGVIVFVPLIIVAVRGLKTLPTWTFRHRWMGALGIASVLLVFWPLLYWDPMYDKLWLLPLAILAAALVYVARIVHWAGRTRALTVLLLLVLMAIELPANLSHAIADSRSPTDGLPEAVMVMKIVTPDDGVVTDFDKISALYVAYAGIDNAVVLPALDSTTAGPAVTALLEKSQQRHGRLYFLGILDENEASWNSFLGDRLGIPYSSLDDYRAHSRVLRQFQVDNISLTLRVYEP